MAEDIFPPHSLVSREERSRLLKQQPLVIWMTGLSGSGKTTLAKLLEKELLERGKIAYSLDGDTLRAGLNKDLGFSDADRKENVRRAGEICRVLADAGMIVITSFISPFKADRDAVRALFPKGQFIEVYVKASIEACEKRDTKGLYKKARAGEIKNFTGIDSPYEAPEKAEVVVDTESESVEKSVSKLLTCLGI
ncbi:MAG: adenylyl-sulfate kinase [Bacteroidetes bacterium]|nr:adenylyl-sulfate kinase [Bacteroidota bacterium]